MMERQIGDMQMLKDMREERIDDRKQTQASVATVKR